MENWITPLSEVVDEIYNKEFGEFDAMIVIAHQEGIKKEDNKPNTTYSTYGKRDAIIANVYKYLCDDKDLIKDFQIAINLAAANMGVKTTLRDRIKMRLLARRMCKVNEK